MKPNELKYFLKEYYIFHDNLFRYENQKKSGSAFTILTLVLCLFMIFFSISGTIESAFMHTLALQGCHITLYKQYSNQLSPMCTGRCIAGVRNEFQCSETKLLLWFACLSSCSRSCSSSREGKITTFDHGKFYRALLNFFRSSP